MEMPRKFLSGLRQETHPEGHFSGKIQILKSRFHRDAPIIFPVRSPKREAYRVVDEAWRSNAPTNKSFPIDFHIKKPKLFR